MCCFVSTMESRSIFLKAESKKEDPIPRMFLSHPGCRFTPHGHSIPGYSTSLLIKGIILYARSTCQLHAGRLGILLPNSFQWRLRRSVTVPCLGDTGGVEILHLTIQYCTYSTDGVVALLLNVETEAFGSFWNFRHIFLNPNLTSGNILNTFRTHY